MKNKIVNVKKDETTGDTYLELVEVLRGTNVKLKRVDSYELTFDKNTKTIILQLFDKKGKLIKVKETSEK